MQERRFKPLAEADMTPEQLAAYREIVAGPRGAARGPFGALLRSPELAGHAQRLGAYVRFGSSLPARLNELAILVTARYWSAQFEWHAHHALALQAGLDPAIAADIAAGRRPARLDEDAAAVHDFCRELHEAKQVSDAAYARALGRFGERGVVDLIAACGYYTLVSMVLNVERHPLPEGVSPPFAPPAR